VLSLAQDGVSAAQQKTPDWWSLALRGSGLVLKPLRGHGGRAVMRFRWTAAGLKQEALFRRLPDNAAVLIGETAPEPQQLLEHWQRLCRTDENALATPYLSHSPALPATQPSVVVRVITARATPEAAIGIRAAWLEVPLGEGSVAFCSTSGHALPSQGVQRTANEQAALERWQRLLQAGVPACVQACLQASQTLHAQLPPIDQVAWDWIPTEPQPMLLEGNGGFGGLVPQLFAAL
jgi:hypothetical protein